MKRPRAWGRSGAWANGGKNFNHERECHWAFCKVGDEFNPTIVGTASHAGKKCKTAEKTRFRKRVLPSLYDLTLMVDMAQDEEMGGVR